MENVCLICWYLGPFELTALPSIVLKFLTVNFNINQKYPSYHFILLESHLITFVVYFYIFGKYDSVVNLLPVFLNKAEIDTLFLRASVTLKLGGSKDGALAFMHSEKYNRQLIPFNAVH